MVNFISNDIKLDFNDVLLVPVWGGASSRKLVNLDKTVLCKHSGELLDGTGVIAANMDGVGTIENAKILAEKKVYTALTKNLDFDTVVSFFKEGLETEGFHASDYTFYSMGISDSEYERFVKANQVTPIPRVCIDVANGYMEDFSYFISQVRDAYPTITIMAGNVVTPEAVEILFNAGADIIKMGIGSGGVCTTRLVAGVGYPQFSMIVDSVQKADELGAIICSDGGCVEPGDVAKALAAGADFVMLGTMLAGTGDVPNDDGTVTFYGMSSETANNKHFGGLKNYRASEGRTIKIPYRGTMESVIQRILGGIVSACTYSNTLELAELPYKAQFIRVNNTHNRSMERFTVGY